MTEYRRCDLFNEFCYKRWKFLSFKGFLMKISEKFKRRKNQPFNENMLIDLQARILKLEERQQELEKSLLKKELSVEKIIIERMHADKVEFNMDAIDVKELSGILNIGLNYEGKLIKVLSKDSSKTKEVNKNIVSDGLTKDVQKQKPKLKVFYGDKP